ncbi:hypothetical protein SSX86_028953 [Deinandra increscens subsp. villosa]|uniref:SHSP domain-containing protein n=1 Tax=Deinandra increscens subsp. villosa TaxID=3103831 RepID=A0AAP0C8N1_9ASTR
MATARIVKRGTTGSSAATLFNKLLNPARSVSAVPTVRRCFTSGTSQMTTYDDDDNRDAVDVDRSSRSDVSRRRDRDLFSGGGFGRRRGWEAKEDEESLRFRFDMPGVEKEDVKICVEQNTLVIRAEAEAEEEGDEAPRRYSSRIDLPANAYKFDEIKAELKNGVLKVRVPKVKEEERKDVRQIQVV